MCNLSIIGLVCKKFPESFMHAQTEDTRPHFPPPKWPGYEAREEVKREEVKRRKVKREEVKRVK